VAQDSSGASSGCGAIGESQSLDELFPVDALKKLGAFRSGTSIVGVLNETPPDAFLSTFTPDSVVGFLTDVFSSAERKDSSAVAPRVVRRDSAAFEALRRSANARICSLELNMITADLLRDRTSTPPFTVLLKSI